MVHPGYMILFHQLDQYTTHTLHVLWNSPLHQILSDQQALETILCIEIGHSFFPKDGVYAQLVSKGALELIENTALKNGLLELFTHQKERNFATSKEIDNFNIQLRNSMFKNFRIRFDYDS